ncbi:fimbrial chaperone protein [Enterobacter sp. BIGb0383]|uniref:fimbrial biogenesis chaperone n=1 Tax=unclassified Enterobacter TaxID=2608935 RepID=UPI000F49A4CE|nr:MULTISPECIES: fimbria/pilus periplasmic chaperone [unclassified Enterobacter]ROP62870.1 fimbrial chaperone protein [Enterobacter sp. BIGb0383]ROS13031.1 fimbrial chaperone protein [Enterobacter sp. BIGb0359]
MRILTTIAALALSLCATAVQAGGVGLGATRMVWLSSGSQSVLNVRNTDAHSPFLIQSWIENAGGQRSSDFVVTPPLFVLKPNSENSVRVMFSGPQLPDDRETLYWMVVKAIPQSASQPQNNTLQFASANRIKLFYRPASLARGASNAWQEITGERRAGKITLINPTAYYLTLTNLKVDGRAVKPVMIPPKDRVTLSETFPAASKFSYSTINDYGALTKESHKALTLQ